MRKRGVIKLPASYCTCTKFIHTFIDRSTISGDSTIFFFFSFFSSSVQRPKLWIRKLRYSIKYRFSSFKFNCNDDDGAGECYIKFYYYYYYYYRKRDLSKRTEYKSFFPQFPFQIPIKRAIHIKILTPKLTDTDAKAAVHSVFFFVLSFYFRWYIGVDASENACAQRVNLYAAKCIPTRDSVCVRARVCLCMRMIFSCKWQQQQNRSS